MKKVVRKTCFRRKNRIFQSWKVELPVFQDISAIRLDALTPQMRRYFGENAIVVVTRGKFTCTDH